MEPYAMKSDFIDKQHARGNTASMTTENKTTENKTLVGRALAELITTGGADALEPLLSDDFVHHRPDSTSSTKAQWLAAVREALVPLAGMQVEVVHLLSEGDHVVMHSRRRLPAGGPEIAVVDIWRIEDGLIAEGWEIIEPTARAAANLVWWEPAER
ncbi:nuclear transport factor 2 family protein [Streptomyces tendae]|uniref:nuclear transport factor 2 family protein n=2 Tax=Streptomyces tendae TaxID=1932 RepID=UPI00364ABF20